MAITRKPLISYLTADKCLLSSVQNKMHPLLRTVALQTKNKTSKKTQNKTKHQTKSKRTQENKH